MNSGTDLRLRDDANADRVASFGREFGENADLRRRFANDPRAVLAEQGFDVSPDVELRVAASTDETYYLAMSPDPNESLADENLGLVAGGNGPTAGSVGSIGTFGCSCGPSSVASIGSISSAASD